MAKSGRRLKFRHFFVGFILLCGLGGFGYEWLTVRKANQTIASEVARLQALKIPTSPDEMPKPGPDDRNAALIYREAIQLKQAIGAKRPTEMVAGAKDPDFQGKLTAFLVAQQPVMELVRQAATRPDCNFKRDWSQGASMLLPEFSDLKDFTRIATENAAASAKVGKFSESISWLRVAKQVSVHTRDPIPIGFLVSVACEQIYRRELQSQIRLYSSNPEFVRLTRQFCDEPSVLPSVRDSMAGEVLLVRTAMADIASGKMRVSNLFGMSDSDGNFFGTNDSTIQALRIPSVRKSVEAKLLTRYRVTVEGLPVDPGDLKATLAATANLDTEQRKEDGIIDRLASLFTPVFTAMGQSSVKLEATRRVTRQGLAIFVHKAERGSYLKALDAKKPWAIDPFNDKPLRYKFIVEGFELYSVGPNGKDDGGPRKTNTGNSQASDDVVFYRPEPPVKPKNKMKSSP
ncbi:MAG: hypothetical protein ABL962_10520 [Fimbriimonadaceae bacterium]